MRGGMKAGADMRELVPFAGLGRSPAGNGVDMCLHSERVRKNPTSNPNLAWNGAKAFTIMAHGIIADFGPVLIDETGTEEQKLTPQELVQRINSNADLKHRFDGSETIVLYACGSGRQTPDGFPSFASRLARLTGKPVIAPSSKLYMTRGIGSVASGGIFRVETPDSKSFMAL